MYSVAVVFKITIICSTARAQSFQLIMKKLCENFLERDVKATATCYKAMKSNTAIFRAYDHNL